MGEPKYIGELKVAMGEMAKSVAGAEKAIVRIDTTLAENLPELKGQLQKLNGTVRGHDTDLALQKQAHEDCPARKAFDGGQATPGSSSSGPVMIDLRDRKVQVVVGGVVGAPALVLALELLKFLQGYMAGG